MAKTYTPVGWEDGEIVSPAVADLETGIVTPAQVSGTTPVNAENLNKMDQAIKDLYDEGTTSKDIVIGNETEVTEDTKIFIDTGELGNLGSEVVNSLDGNEVNKAPSVKTINDNLKPIYYNLSTYLNNTQFQNITRSKCTKQNGIVNISFFSGYLSTNASSNDITLLNNLPNDLIPDTIIDFLVIALGTSNTILGRGYININEHKLMLWFPSVLDTTYRLIFNCSYNVNNNEEV